MRSLLFLGCCLCLGQASAQFYRCVGASGEVSFQGVACLDGEERRLSVRSAYSAGEGLRQSEVLWLKRRERLGQNGKKKRKPKTTAIAQSQQEKRCWKKQQQLNTVKAKLRRGYKPAQGDKLRRKRKSYEQYLFQFCG